MRIAIVDDDLFSRTALCGCIKDSFKDAAIAITKFSVFKDGHQFLNGFVGGEYDLIVLDILMGDLGGIDVARTIRQKDTGVRIAFCTSSNNFASEAFGVEACHYILKPPTKEEILAMVSRLKLSELMRNRYIFLPDGQRVLLRSILYIECIDHLLFFHLTSGSVLRSRIQQHRMEEMLSPFPEFFTCSKGVIVNFDHVAKRSDNTFIMSDGASLPISRRRVKETVMAFENHLFDLLRLEAE